MLKAALLTPNLTMGGAEMWVASLASSVDRRRLRWTGAVVSGWGGLDPFLCRQLAQHVPVHTNHGGWNRQPGAHRLATRYFQQIHAEFGDAIRAACREADILVAWGGVDPKKYAPDIKIPIVQTSHTTEPAAANGGGFQSATHLAAVSEAAKAHFSSQAAGRKVTVIYNGANLNRCQPMQGRDPIRAQWGIAEDDVAVGYLGRHSPEKNPQAAVDAVSRLPENHYAIYYGGPTPRDQTTTVVLREHARQVAPGRVIFRSSVEQVGDVLAGLDVFMLASCREAFSLGLIEAWLAGVPVVATPVGSLPELEKRFGKLTVQVPLDASASVLAKAVRVAKGDAGQHRAERAQSIAREHFTSEAMANRWTDYLQSIVSPLRKQRLRRSAKNSHSIATTL
ncbi:glycosyltransferase family 4 protein [Novipirellula artificiosorum]|uniref:D-inositol 3-phosphate glycosyltransferase n=1 Tax=Novipirellula artificiosorum TaxID=2528016 RepID=A0A5C6E533_9BACT|nr:glycosyltransferase family 4 protein [Novipirellula artificiosorum]TWU42536.1 D-inositol 3-phosphate glycosyltransferase [Novipirellula artificiosorum]